MKLFGHLLHPGFFFFGSLASSVSFARRSACHVMSQAVAADWAGQTTAGRTGACQLCVDPMQHGSQLCSQ